MSASGRAEVARGSAWALLAWLVGTVTGPFLAVLLVRSMSHREYGALSVSADAVSLLAVFLAIGLSPAVSQLLVEGRVRGGEIGERTALRATKTFLVYATIAALPITAGVGAWFAESQRLHLGFLPFCVMAPVALLAPMNGVLTGACRALQWPRRLAAGLITSSAIVAVVVLLEVNLTRPGALEVASAFAVRPVVLIAVLIGPVAAWWRRGPTLPTSRSGLPVRRLGSFAFSFALAMSFGTLVAQLDVIVLGAVKGPRLAGLYSPASAVGNFAILAPAVIGNFFQPAVTRLIAERREDAVARLYAWTTRITVAFTAPVLAVLVVCPGSALRFVFGPSLAAESTPLRILGIGALAAVITGFNAATLDAHGWLRFTNSRLASVIVLSVVACVLLIPPLGAAGAALATTAALLADNAICSIALHRRFAISPWDWRAAVTVATFGLSLVVCLVVASAVSGSLERCLAVAVIAGAMTATAALAVAPPDEKRALFKALRSQANPFQRDFKGSDAEEGLVS